MEQSEGQDTLPIPFEFSVPSAERVPPAGLDFLHYPLQEVFIPVWNQVRLSRAEMTLVDHPAFKRLANIYQLGQTHLVFRGATHRRWEHAVGTLHAAQQFISAVERTHATAAIKGLPSVSGQWRMAQAFQQHEVILIRMGALLHDLGHVAAGHTFEDELGLLEKHDEDKRLSTILDKASWRGREVRTLRSVLNELYAEPASLTGTGMEPSEILLELVSKTRAADDYETPLRDSDAFRIHAARDVIGNTICADLLDYIHRDWHHLGKPRTMDDRLLEYFELRQRVDSAEDTSLVVNLREGASIRNDAVTAIFELLESRYQLGEVALFHRTKLTAAAMLERVVAEIADAADDKDWFAGQLDAILECTDEELLEFLWREGKKLPTGRGHDDRRQRLNSVLGIVHDLRYRNLHKQILAFDAHDLGSKLGWVRATLGGAVGAGQRLTDCRSLEEDFKLPYGSVVMYCPARPPHAKIAEVKVLVNGDVSRLHKLEDPGSLDTSLTSGILRAQLERFNRLWRVQVSVSKEARSTLEAQDTLSVFLHTVEWLVLRADRSDMPLDQAARELASMLVHNARYDTTGFELVPVGEMHARTREIAHYGSGAPTLRSLLARA